MEVTLSQGDVIICEEFVFVFVYFFLFFLCCLSGKIVLFLLLLLFYLLWSFEEMFPFCFFICFDWKGVDFIFLLRGGASSYFRGLSSSVL